MKVFYSGLAVLFVLLIGAGIDRYVIGLECTELGRDTTYTKIPVVEPDKPEEVTPELTTEEVNDAGEVVNVDSLQEALWTEAKDYWRDKYKDSVKTKTVLRDKPVVYVAQMDTSYNDSLVTMDIDFISPIPIHPGSKFRINNLQVKRPEINVTLMKKRTFWDVIIPNPSIGVMLGYGTFSRKFDVFVGAGFTWEIGKGDE